MNLKTINANKNIILAVFFGAWAGIKEHSFAKRFPSNNQTSWLRRGCYLPSQESAICPFVGLSANGIRWTICSSQRTGSKLELKSRPVGQR